MTKRSVVTVGVIAGLCFGAPAHAHHGRDFLLTQTADLPHPGDFYLVPRQDVIDEADGDEIEFEPTFLVGAADWLALEVHGHVAKRGGESFDHESTAAAFHVRVTPAQAPLRVGVSAEYEFSHLDERDDRIEVRLVASKVFGGALLAFNVMADEELRDGVDADWGYLIGFRKGVSDRLAWGLEAQGSLEEPKHEALVGFYLDPMRRFTVNLGVGTGLRDSEIDFSLRTAVVWHVGRVGSRRK